MGADGVYDHRCDRLQHRRLCRSVRGHERRRCSSRPQPHLVGWRDTLAPFAFVKFSTQQSDQCSKRGEGAAVELTGAKRALLQRINFEINNEITYSNEADDDRKVGARVGDCADFALTKRQRLLDAGWPSGALQQPARNQASAMRF